MNFIHALRRLTEVTESQWGMITSAQATALGVSHVNLARLADSGDLVRLAHGVYRAAGAPSDEHEDLRAAWLGIEPRRFAWDRIQDRPSFATVSGESAATLHGIGDLRALRNEFTTLKRKQSQRPDVKYRTRALTREDVTLRQGLPVTTVERTIADLVEARTELSLVGGVLRDASVQFQVDRSRLIENLDPLTSRYGFRSNAGEDLLTHIQVIAGITPESFVFRLAQSLMIVTPEKLEQLSPEGRTKVHDLAREMISTLQNGAGA